MLTYWEILTAIQSNVPVNDSYAQLWGKKSQNNYTIVTYTGTLPATLTGTKAGYLHKYKIYGNTEQIGTPTPENPIVPSECGERTENLVDYSFFTSTPFVTVTPITNGVNLTGAYFAGIKGISLSVGTTYHMSWNAEIISGDTYVAWRVQYTDDSYSSLTPSGKALTITKEVAKILFYVNAANTQAAVNITNLMLNTGSTALPYEPYGYKLPLTSGSTPVDIYIGDDTLSTEEYVDSDTGKIYRMVGGVLTPVDPPVPFPNIPTSAGSTTISWAGEGLAPSQVELEYEKKR
jgi:hypothetical protein